MTTASSDPRLARIVARSMVISTRPLPGSAGSLSQDYAVSSREVLTRIATHENATADVVGASDEP